MKTAMQELMQWMEETEFMVNSAFIDKVNECLEKEKEQIIEFGYKCRDNQKKLPQDIFNQTYNQNK